METTTTKVSDERCSGRCGITYGSVQDYANDVTIRAVTKTQLNVRTGAEVASTRQNVPPANLDPEIQAQLRRFLRRFVYESHDCRPGCYCDSFGQIETRQETVTLTLAIVRNETRTWAWIDPGQDTVQETIEKVKSGQAAAIDNNTGQPVTFDPDLDDIGSTNVNCCGGFRKLMDLEIVNRFKYVIEIEAKLTLATEEGECKPIGGSGGTVV